MAAVVKGRVQIEDTVVEKIAALAAVEVSGVFGLGGSTERVHARIEDRQVWIHAVIVIEYGAVVIDVARAVKASVARAVSRMLGLRVVEVNVTVDDVAMPRQPGGTTPQYPPQRQPTAGEGSEISPDPLPATVL
jgi:uncharacterized alkaline shock family protein YloU